MSGRELATLLVILVVVYVISFNLASALWPVQILPDTR